MFRSILKSKVLSSVIAAALLGGLPTAAFAHHHGFYGDVIIPAPVVVVPAPACAPVSGQIWVPPVYQTVTDRVWIDPVTTTQIQRVEVPAQYAWRDVVFYDFFGRAHVRHERVEIIPAHCEDRAVQVVVTPGHFEEQIHQQLVCDGHWETVAPQPVTEIHAAGIRLEFPLPF